MTISAEQQQRYARQIMLEEFGVSGQEKLKDSSVLVIGAGGLGSAILYYLAAAGVGRLGIVDSDVVDLSNLQRQILHGIADLGRDKVTSAVSSLGRVNPHLVLEPICRRLNEENIDAVVEEGGYDMVVDAVDSFGAKYLINDACVRLGRPFVHGGATGFAGQVMTYIPGHTCLRCVFPSLPAGVEAPAGLGIVGAVAGTIGTMQALEVIKLILGAGDVLVDRLLSYDGLSMRTTQVVLARSMQCPACGTSD